MGNIGLAFVTIGWLIQFFGKSKNIKIGFILSYMIGVIFLIIDGYLSGLTILAALNLISLIIALGVFFKIKK